MQFEQDIGRYSHQMVGEGISLDGRYPQYHLPTSKGGLEFEFDGRSEVIILNLQTPFLDPKVSIERILPCETIPKLNFKSDSTATSVETSGKTEVILWVNSIDRSKIYDFDIRIYPEVPDLVKSILLNSEEVYSDPKKSSTDVIMEDIVGRLLVSPTDFAFERNEDTIFIFDEDGIKFLEGYDANTDGTWSENYTRLETGPNKQIAEWVILSGKIEMNNTIGESEIQSFTITAGVEFTTDNFSSLIHRINQSVSRRDYKSLKELAEPFVEIMFIDPIKLLNI